MGNNTEVQFNQNGEFAASARFEVQPTGSTDGATDNGFKLFLGGGVAKDSTIIFDGNAQDFHMSLDDSDDKLKIGHGVTIGTTPAIQVASGGVLSLGASGVASTVLGTLDVNEAMTVDYTVSGSNFNISAIGAISADSAMTIGNTITATGEASLDGGIDVDSSKSYCDRDWETTVIA